MKTNLKVKNPIVLVISGVVFFAVITGLMYIGVIDEYIAQLLSLSGIYAIVGISLNLVSGFTGQLALGQAGLMAIGAYTTSTLIMQYKVPMFIAILCGGIMTALFGFIIGMPTLRLRGDYLAITTLGFGEVIRVVLVNMEKVTGGAAGLKGIPPFIDTPDFKINYIVKFIWIFVFLVAVIVGVKNLITSSPGRALISIREDEVAANSMGINSSYYKVFAFTLSAALAGIGGGLYAIFFGYINPQVFTWIKSIDFVVVVVLGGMGSITGTIIASLAFVFTQDLLWFIGDWRLVIYGLLLVLLMRFRPQGIMGNKDLSIIGLWGKLSSKLNGKKTDKKSDGDVL